jgi:aspartyl-tRNA(Asn)/glutamyl-tRNA(Gln) amidotransferase subunit B
MSLYETVIGLEVHTQLLSRRKIFSGAPVARSKDPNLDVDPVAAGMPGSLPVINRKAVELAIRAGLACNCEIRGKSVFARKNYFYPDLPKGYQISQFDEPICVNGFVEFRLPNGNFRRIGIQRIHMEEDAGKSFHMGSSTLVDLNRAGVGLCEIVTRPELRSPIEASSYLRSLHALLIHAGVSDGNLEEGNFRCDVNISVRKVGDEKLGTRVEIKNLNSFRFVEKSLEYEIARQVSLVSGGGKVVQETRGWDSAVGKTFTQRLKEEAEDYRYFPDPDLPPLIVSREWLDSIKKNMPELPDQIRRRFCDEWGLNPEEAETFIQDPEACDYFQKVVGLGAPARSAASWVLTELGGVLGSHSLKFSQQKMKPESLIALLKLIDSGILSVRMAKDIFPELVLNGEDPQRIVETRGLRQMDDSAALTTLIEQVLQTNADQVAEYRAGKTKVYGFFVGQIMKATQGKASPELVNRLLAEKLGGGPRNDS